MDPARDTLLDPSRSCWPLLSAGATCSRISEIVTDDMNCSPSFWWSAEGGPGSKTKVQGCLSEPYCAASLIFGERRKRSELGVPSLCTARTKFLNLWTGVFDSRLVFGP